MENNELGLPAQVRTPALGGESRARQRLRDVRRRIGSAFAAVAAVIAKFFAAIKGAVLLLPKVKLLTTAGTMLVSVVLYSLVFGWAFAIGFVVLLLVHEMGHVIQLRREGIRASAPVFIPFMGAVVGMKQMPGDAQHAAARGGVRGLLLEPHQPRSADAVRRRPRDGGDGAGDVVRGPRRDGRAAADDAQRVPVDLRAVRRL